MKGALRQALTVAAKDLRVAGRTRDTLLATAFFAGIVLLVLGFALSGGVVSRDARLSAPLAAGAIWTALALAAAVGAQRAFAQEQEAGALDQLLAYPGPHGALYLGKLLGVLPPLLLVAAVTVPTGLVLFGASEAVTAAGRALPWLALALTTTLGVLGFAAATTFYGSITVNLRAREALLPALAFPILVPAVLATVQATRLLLEGGWSPEVGTWLTFLTAFDLGTIILATLLFPAAVEG